VPQFKASLGELFSLSDFYQFHRIYNLLQRKTFAGNNIFLLARGIKRFYFHFLSPLFCGSYFKACSPSLLSSLNHQDYCVFGGGAVFQSGNSEFKNEQPRRGLEFTGRYHPTVNHSFCSEKSVRKNQPQTSAKALKGLIKISFYLRIILLAQCRLQPHCCNKKAQERQ
jgi:hypothetical protein